jgi:predicted nucleic acid-binding protein
VTTTLPPRYVVDASIALKWYLRDEQHAAEARAVEDDFGAGTIRLIAPDHVRYEIANALRVAERSRRITGELATGSLTRFLTSNIELVESNELLLAGFDYASRYGCAVYDGLYLALADMAQCPLVHADRRLHNTLAGTFARELWIEDYTAAQT